MSLQPITTTIPNRAPFVRDTPFIDDKGPPPFDFFDKAQDHLGAYFHAALGWQWSAATEDFDDDAAPAGVLGDFRILQNIDVTGISPALDIVPLTSLNLGEQGEHGVYSLTNPINTGWRFEMQTGDSFIGQSDFLYTCKVKVVNRSRLSRVVDQGLHISMGPKVDHAPGFAGGGDQVNWQVFCPPTLDLPGRYFDTGIPLLDGRWYHLQWCRVAGALRWFVNGRLCLVDGRDGIYLPAELGSCRRYLMSQRWNLGPPDDGFFLDFFHCLRKRV